MKSGNVKRDVTIEECMKYYSHTFYCTNCGDRNYRHITMGVKIKDVSFECDRCGCIIKEDSNS
jgi:transcription elongation factor Elf1